MDNWRSQSCPKFHVSRTVSHKNWSFVPFLFLTLGCQCLSTRGDS